MSKELIRTLGILAVCFFGFASSLKAVGVDYEGYFRFRQNFNHNLNLDRETENWRNYGDFRFRLNPTFYITDTVRVHGSLNFIDGVMGGNPSRAHPHTNPAQANDFIFSDPGHAGTPTSSDNSWVYGGAFAPGGAVRTTELSPIQVRRAWTEVELPFGIVKAGRMPFHFGLGILGNSGDEIDQEVGSTRDRFIFETAFGDYYLRPGFGWFFEGLLDDGKQDAYEYFFELGRRTDHQNLGLYIGYQAQGEASAIDTTSILFGEKTNYWIIDLYVMQEFNPFRAHLESALFTGTFLGRDLFAVNAVGRLEWERSQSNLTAEIGFSSGTSDADAAANRVRTFAFNRDYNIALILFNEALPGGRSFPGQDPEEATPSTPHSGTIANIIYLRSNFRYEMTSYFHPEINVVGAFAPKESNDAGGAFYGFEYDLITHWPFHRYASAEVSFGHFIPGSFYKNVSAAHSSILVRTGLNVQF